MKLLFITAVVALIQVTSFSADNDASPQTFESPLKTFTLTLTPTREPASYLLSINKGGDKLSEAPFRGTLVDAYWSPSEDYVAVNNHYGHWGWWVWVISTADGSVVTAHGRVNPDHYDRYTDYSYLPNIMPVIAGRLRELYPGFSEDRMRLGYSSIAYGWNRAALQLFHELIYDKLVEERVEIIAKTEIKINDQKLELSNECVVNRAHGFQEEFIPAAVKKTLDFSKR